MTPWQLFIQQASITPTKMCEYVKCRKFFEYKTAQSRQRFCCHDHKEKARQMRKNEAHRLTSRQAMQ